MKNNLGGPMKLYNCYLLLFLSVISIWLLSGCAQTKGYEDDSHRGYQLSNDVHGNSAPVFVYIGMELAVDKDDTASVTQRDNVNKLDIPVNAKVPVNITEAIRARVVDGVKQATQDVKPEEVKPVDVKPEEVEPNDVKPIPEEVKPEAGNIERALMYNGRKNGDRPTWYFRKYVQNYPNTLLLDVPGCYNGRVLVKSGTRYEKDGIILKNSDVTGRKMALVVPSACKGTEAAIRW